MAGNLASIVVLGTAILVASQFLQHGSFQSTDNTAVRGKYDYIIGIVGEHHCDFENILQQKVLLSLIKLRFRSKQNKGLINTGFGQLTPN